MREREEGEDEGEMTVGRHRLQCSSLFIILSSTISIICVYLWSDKYQIENSINKEFISIDVRQGDT